MNSPCKPKLMTSHMALSTLSRSRTLLRTVTYKAHYSISFEVYTRVGMLLQKRIHVYANQSWYAMVVACHIQRLQIRGNAPTPSTHSATPTLHPTWFTHQAMAWLCTHQVLLSYLQYGAVTSINNTSKSLSNSKTFIVTYKACYL